MKFGSGAAIVPLACAFGGYYFFGPIGVLAAIGVCGILTIAVIACAARWSASKSAERVLYGLIITVSLVAGAALVKYGVDNELHVTRERMREAARLQDRFRSDPRFESVLVSYKGPPRHSGEWLSVVGHVQNRADYNRLHNSIYNDRTWTVDWSVIILANSSPRNAAATARKTL